MTKIFFLISDGDQLIQRRKSLCARTTRERVKFNAFPNFTDCDSNLSEPGQIKAEFLNLLEFAKD